MQLSTSCSLVKAYFKYGVAFLWHLNMVCNEDCRDYLCQNILLYTVLSITQTKFIMWLSSPYKSLTTAFGKHG